MVQMLTTGTLVDAGLIGWPGFAWLYWPCLQSGSPHSNILLSISELLNEEKVLALARLLCCYSLSQLSTYGVCCIDASTCEIKIGQFTDDRQRFVAE